jgi:lambda repressor-like predicted transcriptional regulator
MAGMANDRVSVAPLRSYLAKRYPGDELTARRVGEMVGVTESRVWRWNGRGLTIDSARKVAAELGVEPQDIWKSEWRPHAKADATAERYLAAIAELSEQIETCNDTVRLRALVACEAREAGVSVMAIARAAGVSHPTMLDQMERHGGDLTG